MTDGSTLPSALGSDVAKTLMQSRIPARLAFTGKDGTPRVLPIWFHWNGEALVLASGATSPKVHALRRHPDVALTIDSEAPPYRTLQIRGRAEIDIVDGVAPEYILSAHHYYGEKAGELWLERMRQTHTKMARIVVRPTWARTLDVASLLPELARALADRPNC